MLRWTEEEMAAYQRRQGRPEAKAEARDHQVDQPRSKYKNKKTKVDGMVMDSRLEAGRYVDLKRMQEAGIVSGLQCQVPYVIAINGVFVCKYFADFVYLDCTGKTVVEDAKGHRTAIYMLKRKLMKACHGIEIQEYRAAKRTKKADALSGAPK